MESGEVGFNPGFWVIIRIEESHLFDYGWGVFGPKDEYTVVRQRLQIGASVSSFMI